MSSLLKKQDRPVGSFSLYNELKRELINNGIVMTVAIPNDIAYPYWKNVVKWKDIGFLEYHALPVKVGNVLKEEVNY